MESDIEIAGAASIGAVAKGHHPVKPGAPCRNCGAVVEARYCTACGQLGTNFHRPILSLMSDAFADVLSLDGRLWRTLPALLFRPGHMTRNYLQGQRVRYMPPFRLFLLASIIFFLTVFTAGDNLGWFHDWKFSSEDLGEMVAVSEEGEVKLLTILPIDKIEAALTDPELSSEERAQYEIELANAKKYTDAPRLFLADGELNREVLRAIVESEMTDEEKAGPQRSERAVRGMEKLARVYENQEKIGTLAREWAPRFSILFAPLFAVSLTLLYFWHRNKYIYDHLISALHYQSFLYIFGAALILAAVFLPGGAKIWVILGIFIPALYLYRLIREVYGTGRFMTVLRMIGLFFATGATGLLLAAGLLTTLFYLA